MDLDLILFDWGGTLARCDRQTEALCQGAAEAARIVTGRPDDPAAARLLESILAAEVNAAVDPDHREVDMWRLVADWAASIAPHAPDDTVSQAGHALGRAWVGCLDPIPGALDMLAELRGRGYRIGLLSNCAVPMPYSLQELERQGFAELLDPIVFSSEVGYRKPSPQVFHEAVRRAYPAGPPDELARVMYVGDSPRLDVTAPASLGMRTALVTREPGVWPEEDYAAARPDLQIDAVTQLPDRLNHRGESV